MPNAAAHHQPPRSPIRRLPSPLRLLRILLWTAAIAYFGLAALVLVTRYVVLPNIEQYRPVLEAALSRSLGLRVEIASLDAQWRGLRPQLGLHGLRVHDREGRPALAFDNVEAELAWSSLWHLQPRLHRLEVRSPVLDMRRDADGRIFIAGLQLNTEAEGTDFSDWLLAQSNIVVRDATLRWSDALRGAPTLELSRVNFRLHNSGLHHRFGVTAQPPRELATALDVRGDFRGEDLDRPEEWMGELYAELEYADLAVWRQWLDYPLELPRGAGGMRLWLDFAHKRLTAITADVALRDVQLRLRRDLPMLDLEYLNGRLAGRSTAGGFEAAARKLALALREGPRIDPTDFQLTLTEAAGRSPAQGEFSASGLDLGALAQLAGHLPLDEALRRKLAHYAPQGRLIQVSAGWKGEGTALSAYKFRGRFENLGLKAQGILPGFHGMSGSVEGSEKGGRVVFQSHSAGLELPRVFPDPLLELQQFTAQVDWTIREGIVDARLQNLSFHNRDAVGSASGTYRSSRDGPGEIDLSARLTRSDGAAVWRYLPLVVNPKVRDWLRAAIAGGTAPEATLRLKGDLKDFPFRDNRGGIFQVSARVSDVTLRYAPGWPEIRGINGALLFEGNRMLIKADSGAIYGVKLSQVKAEIPDLEAPEEMLLISGAAAGQVGDFLRFVDNSPVASRIGNFTEDMTGSGEGRLRLKLALPLQRIDDTAVEGEYEFVRNRITVDPELPALTEVSGRLRFTGNSLAIPGINASFLGGPLTIKGITRADGVVDVSLQGSLNTAGLRQQYNLALLEPVSGSAAYRGNIQVKKGGTEVTIDSDLRGVASALPEPFAKAAGEPLPLRYERRPAGEVRRGAAQRSLVRLSVGEVLKALVVRRREGAKAVVERAAVGIGEAVALPEQGAVLAATVKRFDADAWKRLLPESGGEGLPGLQIALRAGELIVYGRKLTEFSGKATRQADEWIAQVTSREAAGELAWRGQGQGRLRARLKQLALVDGETAKGAAPQELPGLDVVADNFTLNGKPFGRLELNADNEGGLWKVSRIALVNPDGSLTGSGQWRANATQLNFRLEVNDIGKMLGRLGYSEAVRRGTAQLEGMLSWNGSPLALDYPSLAGTLKLEAAQGQFNKLEPGVGRLLGILSLQALPRRITLDFRDIFSEGFAFDSIAGTARVDGGVMVTDNLQIRGPSAKIFMSGEFNLAQETQNLRVRVQPALGESVAVGAMIANPAIGLAALLAQKVLRDPLDQIFAFEYAVTGTWSDPKVEKLQTAAVKQDPTQ
ncbi:MAG: YhdP family protein [Pseudomonadota bacterium]